jgi:hypothetical protein
VHALAGRWPHPDASSLARLARVLASLPQHTLVVVDGLVASGTPDVVVPETRRLRLVVLVHLPIGHPLAGEAGQRDAPTGQPGPAARERRVLASAAAVLTTSRWTQGWLADRYDLDRGRLHVAGPGADRAEAATGTPSGGELLCVAGVVPAKGHQELFSALATVTDVRWRLVCAGALDLDPLHVGRLREQCAATGLADRVTFAGALAGDELDRAYAAADLVVLASRVETYGLVVTEALAHGLPVLATSVGGIAEAMGSVAGGELPGLLVPAAGSAELGRALRTWLVDAALRERLRAAALLRRTTLSPWSATAERVAEVLDGLAA